MAPLREQSGTRKVVLILILIPVAILFFRRYVGGGTGGGSGGSLEDLETQVTALSERLKDVLIQHRDELRTVEELRALARPLWRIESANPEQEVVAEFTKIARRAQVQNHRVDRPQRKKILNLQEVYEVEFPVQVTAPMRVVTRLLEEMEQSPRVFLWSYCVLRPDNTREPQNVRLNGRVRVLVLSPQASRFLSDEEGRS